MFDCEVCGKRTDSLFVVSVEGAQLSVCSRCARGKEIIDEVSTEESAAKTNVVMKTANEEEELIDGYGQKMRKAREALGIDLKVLGELINEKRSTLLRVEEERMSPSIKLTAKLEKALGIKLSSKPEPEQEAKAGRNEPITLGDAALRKGSG